jgi:acetyl-CoA synthetase
LTDASAEPLPVTADLAGAMAQASDEFETVWTGPEDMALLHFTSGRTGRPKGAVHVHEAVDPAVKWIILSRNRTRGRGKLFWR